VRGVTAIAIALVALLAAAGCQNEAAGPSTSDYAAAKEKQIARRAKEGAQQPAARPAARPQAQAPARAAAPQAPQAPMAMPDGDVQLAVGGYTYDPEDPNKRDPFRSFLLDQAREQAERDVERFRQRRERVAAAGGELLGAAFNLLGELVADGGASQPAPEVVSSLRDRLGECVESDDDGRQRLSITLPDRTALDNLATTLARLLAAGDEADA